MKKLYVSLISVFLASSCTLFQDGDGQVIYHWERENTGVQKFARDLRNVCARPKTLNCFPTSGPGSFRKRSR